LAIGSYLLRWETHLGLGFKRWSQGTLAVMAKSGTKDGTKGGTKSGTKRGTKSGGKSGTKGTPKSGAKREAKSGTKRGAEAKRETKSGAKRGAKSGANRGPKKRMVERHGYLDERGQVVIAARFEDANDFDGGIAIVVDRDGVGLIDRDGAWVLEPTYAQISAFVGPFAAAHRKDGSAVFIDRAGRERYAYVGGIEGDMPAYQANTGGKYDPETRSVDGGRWSILDGEGRTLTELADGERPFRVGPDRVIVSDASGWRARSFDGRVLGPTRTGSCFILRGGRHLFYDASGWGAYDDTGEVAIAPRFRSLSDFAEGRAVAWLGGEDVAVVDPNGVELARARAAEVGDGHITSERFIDGLAKVKLTIGYQDRVNLLRPDGSWVLEGWVKDIQPAHGLFLVNDRGVWEVVDRDGRSTGWTGGAESLFACSTRELYVVVPKGNGILDLEGRWVFGPDPHHLATPIDDERLLVRAVGDNTVGVRRRDGRWVIEPAAKLVIGAGFVAAATGGERHRDGWKDGSWTLYTLAGELVAELGQCPGPPGRMIDGRMRFSVAAVEDAPAPSPGHWVARERVEEEAGRIVDEHWEPPVLDIEEARHEGREAWEVAKSVIGEHEVGRTIRPAGGEVERWTVILNDPPGEVLLVFDATGKLCAAGLLDEIDLRM
jgi:hypothetical protein